MKTDNTAEWLAKRFFEVHGFTVRRIAETQGARRADFVAEHGSEQVLLEVTEKEATPLFTDLQLKAGDQGLATLCRPITPWNTIDKVLRDKSDQLERTPSTSSALRVLWLSACHADDDYVLNATRQRAFGLRNLMVFPARGHPYPMPCFYYDYSTFFRTRSLDGIILANASTAQLCINSFSQRAADLARSTLCAVFPHRAVVDPLALDNEGRAFVLDMTINRGDPRAQWQAIITKYGVRTTAVHESQFVGLVTL